MESTHTRPFGAFPGAGEGRGLKFEGRERETLHENLSAIIERFS